MKRQNNSIRSEFARYAVPAVAGMVVSSLYAVVDGIFVGRGAGEMALAAVNIAYPFVMFQIAVSMLLAIGGANLFQLLRGRGEEKAARNVFNQSIWLLLGVSVVVNLLVMVFSGPLCRLLGADETLLPMSQSYVWWIALFGIPYMPGLALGIFVRNDGSPRLEMAGTLAGALTNIVLDYLFIMVFGWGLPGAAIATGIGQLVSVGVYLLHFPRRRGILQLTRPRFIAHEVKKILANGFASFLMEFSQSAITLSFNLVIAGMLGASGVAAYSIVMYLCSIFNMVLIGVVQGAQPIISYNHGAGERHNVTAIYRLGVFTCLVATSGFYLIALLFGGGLAALFSPGNPELVAHAVDMMRLYFLGFFPIGISLMNILYFQATEREGPAVLLSFLRCIGFVQLWLALLPPLLGWQGICLALLAGEGCNALVSTLLHRRAVRAEARALPLERAENPLHRGKQKEKTAS